jgi:hypothetical protein
MFKLSDLTTLDLAWNSLTGPIPLSIGNLVKLEVLNLSWILNLPVTTAQIGVLEILDLSHNKLDGMIPSDIGDLLRDVVYLQNNPDV